MSSKIKSLEKSTNSLHSEFSEIKTIVLDVKEFFDEWKEKQSVEESERNSDEMQSSESEEQCRPLGWVNKDKQRFKVLNFFFLIYITYWFICID
jgi:vacuolar-type H+-ATPase subunit I/STV1